MQWVTDTPWDAQPPSRPFLPSLGSYVGGPESRRLLQHVHSSREEEGPASPGVCQEELTRHGLLWLDRVPEENPVPLWTNLQVALHQAFHAVQQHTGCRGGPGQHYGKCNIVFNSIMPDVSSLIYEFSFPPKNLNKLHKSNKSSRCNKNSRNWNKS